LPNSVWIICIGLKQPIFEWDIAKKV